METIINVVVITFVVAVVYYVEVFIYKEPLTKKEILAFKQAADQIKNEIKDVKYRARLGLDAETQLIRSRRETKGVYFIFSGMSMALLFVILLFFTEFLSFTNMEIMGISAIALICYGLIKMAESKKLAIGILISIFIFGTLVRIVFDKTMDMSMSPSVYLYLCAVIVLIGIFSLFSQTKPKKA